MQRQPAYNARFQNSECSVTRGATLTDQQANVVTDKATNSAPDIKTRV